MDSKYSVEDMRRHLQSVDQGCIAYTRGYIEDECPDWLARNTNLVYVYDVEYGRYVDVESMLKCNPDLFLLVGYS